MEPKRDPANAGWVSQNTSTRRMKTTSAATAPRIRGLRLADAGRRSRKGSTKWSRTSAAPTQPQPPCRRRRYHGISSGRLPDQMIRYCEKETYAQNITNASISFPRSW